MSGTILDSGRLAIQVATVIGPEERGAKEFSIVLNLALAAALLSPAASGPAITTVPASASAAVKGPALVSHSPWWETVTVTIAGDGQTKGCEYRTSLLPDASKACGVVGGPGEGVGAGGSRDQYTRLTFERRFRPAMGAVAVDQLPSGDTLLGSQVLALAIDSDGAVADCRIVAADGDLTPDYGCAEATAERFEASARNGAGAIRNGYLSILVYGHAENMT